ncbi:MAG TPA: GH3 auxin-responsive promoter family protein, partial [Dehalococcoidia bacterium]
MQAAWEVYRTQGPEALWDRCCGFLDLSLQETMELQHRLLEEQLALLARSALGQQLFRGAEPRNAGDLRAQVPLTSYQDYLSTLGERRDDVLPERPLMWVRTSGRSGQYVHKWVPITERSHYETGWACLGFMLLSAASRRGDVQFRGSDRYLDLLAPPPLVSGAASRVIDAMWPFHHFPPPVPEFDALPFEQRLAAGFQTGLREGVDFTISIASV